MKRLIGITLGIGLWICASVSAHSENKSAPSFQNLKDAVAFISTCLDQQDYQKLSDACAQSNQPNKSVLQALREKHLATPLTKLYAGREFPAKEAAFKLGGHASELGYIHIDFVKKDQAWQLSSIWMCR